MFTYFTLTSQRQRHVMFFLSRDVTLTLSGLFTFLSVIRLVNRLGDSCRSVSVQPFCLSWLSINGAMDSDVTNTVNWCGGGEGWLVGGGGGWGGGEIDMN